MDYTQGARSEAGPAQAFSGEVRMTPIVSQREGSGVVAALVRFEPASRTHWHSHLHGQTLYVAEGDGLVATRDGEVARVVQGDVVWAPPGEEHWHGGGASTCMVHVGIVESDQDGAHTIWLEAVTDAEYEQAVNRFTA